MITVTIRERLNIKSAARMPTQRPLPEIAESQDKILRNRGWQLKQIELLASRIGDGPFFGPDKKPSKSVLIGLFKIFDTLCSDTGSANDRPWNWQGVEHWMQLAGIKSDKTCRDAIKVLSSLGLIEVEDKWAGTNKRRLHVRIIWERFLDDEITQDEEDLHRWIPRHTRKKQKKLFGTQYRSYSVLSTGAIRYSVPNPSICDPLNNPPTHPLKADGVGGWVGEEKDQGESNADQMATGEVERSEDHWGQPQDFGNGRSVEVDSEEVALRGGSGVAVLPDLDRVGVRIEDIPAVQREDVTNEAEAGLVNHLAVHDCHAIESSNKLDGIAGSAGKTQAGFEEDRAGSSECPGANKHQPHSTRLLGKNESHANPRRREENKGTEESPENNNGLSPLAVGPMLVESRIPDPIDFASSRLRVSHPMSTRTIPSFVDNLYFRRVLEFYRVDQPVACLKGAAAAGYEFESLRPRIDYLFSRLILNTDAEYPWVAPFQPGRVVNALKDPDGLLGDIRAGYGSVDGLWKTYDGETNRPIEIDDLNLQFLDTEPIKQQFGELRQSKWLPRKWLPSDAKKGWKPKEQGSGQLAVGNGGHNGRDRDVRSDHQPVVPGIPSAKDQEPAANVLPGPSVISPQPSTSPLDSLLSTPEGREQLIQLASADPTCSMLMKRMRPEIESGQVGKASRAFLTALLTKAGN